MRNHEQDNEIEARLKAMHPAEPDPAVKRRIAKSLEQDGTHALNPWRIPKPLAIVLSAAAMITLALVLLPLIGQVPLTPPISGDPPPAETETEGEAAPPQPGPVETTQPTHHALRLAMRRSPQALDKALDDSLAVRRDGDSSRTTHMYTFADGRRFSSTETLP